MSDHTQSDDTDDDEVALHARGFAQATCIINEGILYDAFFNSMQVNLSQASNGELMFDEQERRDIPVAHAETASEIFVKTISRQIDLAIRAAFAEAEIAAFEQLADAWVANDRLSLDEARKWIANKRKDHYAELAKHKRRLWGATRKRARKVTQGAIIHALRKEGWNASRERIAQSLDCDVSSIDNLRGELGFDKWNAFVAHLKEQGGGS